MENKQSLSFEECHKKVCEQVRHFESNLNYYKSKDYLEAQINNEVYKLYDITPEEVAIIEQT